MSNPHYIYVILTSTDAGQTWQPVAGAKYRSDRWYGTVENDYDGKEAAKRSLASVREVSQPGELCKIETRWSAR